MCSVTILLYCRHLLITQTHVQSMYFKMTLKITNPLNQPIFFTNEICLLGLIRRFREEYIYIYINMYIYICVCVFACACERWRYVSCLNVLAVVNNQSVTIAQVGGHTNVEFLWNQMCHPALHGCICWVIFRFFSQCVYVRVFYETCWRFGSEQGKVWLACLHVYTTWLYKFCVDLRLHKGKMCAAYWCQKTKTDVGRKTMELQKQHVSNTEQWRVFFFPVRVKVR